jgi:hypothetical protein
VDNRHAHFLGIVADICLGSALGRLIVEIETTDGARITGTPVEDTGDAAGWADEINSESIVRIGNHELTLGDIATCRVHAPPIDAAAPPPTAPSRQNREVDSPRSRY